MRIRSDIKGNAISRKDNEVAQLANALSHPLRVALVRYLDKKDRGKGLKNSICNKDLVKLFDYSQSTMSQHVKILVDCGLFIKESKERFSLYYLNRKKLSEFSDFLDPFLKGRKL